MMYPLTICAIVSLHFFADFVLQTRWQAENKSKNITALLAHCLTYTGVLFLFALVYYFAIEPNANILSWAVLNGILHFGIDYFTSKQTAATYNNGSPKKAFWLWIGVDQNIHIVTLILTWYYLV